MSIQNHQSQSSLSSFAKRLVDELGISIIVSGSSLIAEFLPIADQVYKIEDYKVSDVTDEVKTLDITPNSLDSTEDLSSILGRARYIMPSSIDPSSKYDDVYIDVDSEDFLYFGRSIIDTSYINQISSADQVRTIGMILYYAKLRYMDEGYSLREILDFVDRDLSNEGLNILIRNIIRNLARPRRHEIAALINRLPAFRVSHITN